MSSKTDNGDGSYSYTATPTPASNIEDTTNTLTVGTNWSDLAGNNPSSTTNSSNYTVDTIRPNVTITNSDSA